MTLMVVGLWIVVGVLAAVAFSVWKRWSERHWVAKAQRLEQSVPRAVAAELVAQVTPPSRVTVDPYSGFVEVKANSIEEAVHIVLRAPEFFARPEATR